MLIILIRQLEDQQGVSIYKQITEFDYPQTIEPKN